jgi:hypothetical protein
MEQVYEFSTPKIFGATYKLSTLAATGGECDMKKLRWPFRKGTYF